MCRRGGTYYYVDRSDGWEGTWEDSKISADDEEASQNFLFRRRWKRVHIRQGIVVSAMAVHSVAGSVYFRDV
jgi:hypothetical protein